MPTPPNRRPGVDASIVQATTVRGYDGPQVGDAAQDLLISTGQNRVTLAVADILVWNRTDANRPVFVMRPGADLTTAPRFPVFAGALGDPNGIVVSDVGALYVSNNPPALWQNQDGASTWAAISDELGGESLAETLVIGNTTGGTSIVVSNGDSVLGQSNAGGAGFNLSLAGGAATGLVGNGGDVVLAGGTSVAGVSGGIQIFSRPANATNASGNITASTGSSATGGSSGGISFATGNTGAAGFGGSPGWITMFGGTANTTGSAQRAGSFRLESGRAVTDGEGGFVRIVAGDSSNAAVAPVFLAPVAGQGGTVLIQGGSSALARQGGSVTIRAGVGGSAGAQGGNINLNPGGGGGGFPAGEIVGNGVLRASNIQRGSGDPNALAVSGNEGDFYQRTTAGLGQVWLNTNGTPTGWAQLALAGDFVESFEQLNWGSISRVGQNPTGNPEDDISDLGLFEGVRSNNAAGGTVAAGGSLDAGPYIAFTCTNVGDRAAIDMNTGAVSRPTSVSHQFTATFRMRNTVTSDQRIFAGFSQLSAANQLAAALPGGGAYVGFLLDSTVGGNWRVIVSNGFGITGPLDTGVSAVTTSAGIDPYFFVIDATDFALPVIRFFIFDPSLNLLSSISVPTSVPAAGDMMGPVFGVSKIGAPAGQKQLQIVNASIVNDASVVGQGGGSGVGALSLAQVLINGNTTGLNSIQINQGSGIFGVTDDDTGDGASFAVLSGATTLGGNATGSLVVGSANHTVAGATGATGALAITTGFQFGAGSTGDTGTLTLNSGASIGTGGTTGNVVLASGVHSGGVGGTVGDVLIAPGTFASNNANPGLLELRGGSTSLVGVTSGDVTIRTGQQSAASGDTGQMLLATYDAALAGDSGNLTLATGRAGNLSGASGTLTVTTGNGPAGDTGDVVVLTGNATAGTAGNVLVMAGTSTIGVGADVQLTGGDTSAGGQLGGDIVLTPGTGPGGDGEVRVVGKLTVTGLIDPTGLVLDGQPVAPVAPLAGQGLLWVDSTVVPSRLFFLDDTGGSHDISNGGGATSLGSLSDVTLTGPLAGQVLTYNGVDWVNLPGAGGSPLAAILGIGNATGNTAGGILVSAGDRIWGASNLVLDPGAAPGNRVVIDGLRWPDVDGVSGYVLTTDGAGTLSWQVGGGGGGGGTQTFAEAFAQMQWGSCVARRFASPFASADGFFDSVSAFAAGASATSTPTGIVATYPTAAIVNSDAGFQASSSGVTLDSRLLSTFHVDTLDPPTQMRMFAGITTGSVVTQVATASPLERYVGIQLVTDALPAQSTFNFVTDNATGVPTRIDTGIAPSASLGFWVEIDASTPGEVTLTLYDSDHTQLATHTFVANLPTTTASLNHVLAVRTLDGLIKTVSLWSFTTVTRADLLQSIGGGGSNQNLASVLGFGNATGGIAIQGDDNNAGTGTALILQGGSSTGGSGSGAAVDIQGGAPDPAGNGNGGDVLLTTQAGAGTGHGGDITLDLGNGGATNGDGGALAVTTGTGIGGGGGGDVLFTLGSGGAGGGPGGLLQVTTGAATGGNGAGGNFNVTTGNGFGTGDGGSFNLTAGDGGAVGGDGGNVNITVGAAGGGPGVDGEVFITGDTTITGKLTVTGLIDPTGLLLNDQGAVPFVATGNDGGIWVNNSGELMYSNALGDLNISTSIGGGMTWLEALNLAGYGFLGAGNSVALPQAYGVYGSSVDSFVSPGPPPAAITFGTGGDGPFLNTATGADPNSQAWISTNDALIRRDQLFRAIFKFQVTSASNNNERIFIGFTDDPTTQLSVDDPPGNEYLGIVQLHAPAPAHNLQFVARGSGGAMVPIFAVPTDTSVHYLVVDASSATEVVFTLLADDGQTVEATHTEPNSLLLPTLTTSLFPFNGVRSDTGATPRGINFFFSSIVTRADIVNAVSGGGGGGSGGIPLLSAVLAAGNSTGANNLLISRTSPIGIVTESAVANTATAGKNMTFSIGTGSTETGTGSAGGAGGNFVAIGGAGGSTDALAAAGGVGGLVQIGGGAGGANSGGGAAAGAGGSLSLSTGLGGAGSAGSNGGAGGILSIAAGAGGASIGGLGGTGGAISIAAGTGGVGTFGPGVGGAISLSAGSSSANTGGAVSLSSGSGTVGGAVTISASNSTSGVGAGITLTAGNSAGGGGGNGGRVRNVTGVAAGNGNGGAFEVLTGTGSGTGNGGIFTVTTGNGGGTAGDGGAFSVTLGGGAGGGNGGSFILASGAGNAAGLGGNVQLLAGAGGGTNAAGGEVQLVSGNGGGNGDGGNVALVAGTSPGTGTQGAVLIRTRGTNDTRALRFHTFETITAAGAGLVVLTNAYTLTANQTAVHIQGQVTGQGMTSGNAVVYAIFDGVWYRNGGVVVGAGFHGTVTTVGGAGTDAPVWTVLVDTLGNNIRINVRGSTIAGTNQNVRWIAQWSTQQT
jgi:hypothetical protein